MGLHTVNVWHRLNASEEGGRAVVSLGVVDAQRNVPPQVLSAVDELLENIAPAGEMAAYAVKRFGSPGETGSFVCLVASHRYVDRWDRRAALNHARILRVDSADPWLDVHALVELAVEFESDNALVMSPEGIRDRVLQVENNVQVTEWSEMPFEEVEHALAQTVIEICVSRVSNPEPIAVPLPPQSSTLAALRGAAAAWASLPMAIQRASEFSIDARKGTRVKILFTTAAGSERPTVTQQTRDFAATYIQWLHDCPDDARALIMNPDISDGPTLLRAFEARAPLPIPRDDARALTMNAGISEATTLVNEFDRGRAPRPMQREERTMAKNKRPAEGPRRELDPAVTRYINEQVADAEESLKEYVNRWMSSSEVPARRTMSGGQPVGAPSPVRPGSRLREMAIASVPGAIAGAAMAFFVMFLMRPHAPAAIEPQSENVEAHSAPAAPATHDAAIAVQPATPTPADKLPGEDWAHRFQYLGEREPRRLGALVTNIATVESPLLGQTAKSFTAMNDQLNGGRPLKPQDSNILRVILFQMLAHQISGLQITIDGKYGPGTAAAIPAIRDVLKLESKAGTADDIANLEAEAILRWAARENL
jgi:hypothetical protein